MKTLNTNLVVNVNGGGRITTEGEQVFKKGTNTVHLPKVGSDTSPSAIDVVEAGKAKFGSLDDIGTRVDNRTKKGVKNWGAKIDVVAARSGRARFNVHVDVNASVTVSHRIVVRDDGTAELSSKALVTNSSRTPIKNAGLTITAGDNGNNNRAYATRARAASLESVGGSVSAASAAVYAIAHGRKISLAPGEAKSVSLYDQHFALGKVGRVLEYSGSAYDSAKEQNGGPVGLTYIFENSKANGAGVILPRGGVEVKTQAGLKLLATSVNDISVDDQVTLSGATAFDIEVKRARTTKVAGEVYALENESKVRPQTLGQAVSFKNAGKLDEVVQVSESIGGSADGSRPAAITSVSIDGRNLDTSAWTFDAESGELKLNVKVVAGKTAKLAYEFQTVVYA